MSRADLEARLVELKEQLVQAKGTECEVYSRVVGYFRPVKQWNPGMQSQFTDRVVYELKKEVVK